MRELTESGDKMKAAECSVYCVYAYVWIVCQSKLALFLLFIHLSTMSIQMQTVCMQPHTWSFQTLFEHALMLNTI